MDEWTALDLSLKSAKGIRPKNGWVPDEATAIRVAEAIATAQWGETRTLGERPFKARLRGEVWTVHGTLHPQGAFGGTAVVQLNKTTGAVLLALHQE